MIYRVEFRKDGSIASCVEVETSLKSGGLVVYVDAISRTDAIKDAKKYWTKWSESRRARLSAAGTCSRCGKEPVERDRSIRYCKNCLALARESAKESRKIAALPANAREKAVAERTASANKSRDARLAKICAAGARAAEKKSQAAWDRADQQLSHSQRSTLKAVLRAYDRDPERFRSWLCAKLGAVRADLATAAE